MSRSQWFSKILIEERPETIALAESLSIAAIASPTLVRRTRLELHPGMDAGTEADLWFSGFVLSRATGGVVFHAAAAEVLRTSLARTDPSRLDRAWKLTSEIHSAGPPAILLEEEMLWLSARKDEGSSKRIREILRSVLGALVAGERSGLAAWAARAIPRMPAWVRSLEESRMLEAASRVRLTGEMDLFEARPEWQWLLPSGIGGVHIGVRMFPLMIEIGPTDMPHSRQIQVLKTRPVTLTIAAGGVDQPVSFEPGHTVRMAVPPGPVTLRTSEGLVYDLIPVDGASQGVTDFEELLSQHREISGPPEFRDAVLRDMELTGRVQVITGPPGSGKTALMAYIEHHFRNRGAAPPDAPDFPDSPPLQVICHFFSDMASKYRDAQSALQSLCAQIRALQPDIAPGGPATAEALSFLLGNFRGRLLVLIDAPEEMEGDPLASPLFEALSRPLPQNVGVVVAHWEILFHWHQNHPSRGLVHRMYDPDPALARETVRAIIEAGVEPRLREPLIRVAWDSLLHAKVLARFRFWPEYVSGEDPLRMVWDELGRAREYPIYQDMLGIIAAMREPAEQSWIEEVRRWGPLPPNALEKITAFVWGTVEEDGKNFRVAPRHTRIREFIRTECAQFGTPPDRHLSRAAARWVLRRVKDPRFSYMVRYGLEHAMAANHSSVLRMLSTDLNYLKSKHAAGVRVADELERVQSAAGGDESDPVLATLRHIFMERAEQMRRSPGALDSLVHTALVHSGLDPMAVAEAVSFADGLPMLRLLQPVLENRPSEVAVLTPGSVRHSGPVTGCFPFADSLLTWSSDATIRLWDVESRYLNAVFTHHSAEVTACAALEDGSRFISCGRDRMIVLFDRERILDTQHHNGEVLGFAADEETCVSWGADKTLRVWRIENEALEPRYVLPHDAEIRSYVFSDPWLITGLADGTLCFWDFMTGELRHTERAHDGPVSVLRIHSGTLVSAGQDCTLRVWLLEGEKASLKGTLTGHALGILDCAVNAEGTQALTASLDRTLRWWDIRSHELLGVFEGHASAVLQCAFIDDNLAVSGGADGTVRSWSLADGREQERLSEYEGAVRSIVVSEGKLFVCSDNRTVSVMNLHDTAPVLSHLDTTDEILGLAPVDHESAYEVNAIAALNTQTNDSVIWKKRVAGMSRMSDDGIVFLWTSVGEVLTWSPGDDPLQVTGPLDATGRVRILDVFVSNSDAWIAAVDPAEGLVLTTVPLQEGSRHRQVLEKRPEQVRSAWFCNDGRYLITSAPDGTMQLRRLDEESSGAVVSLFGHEGDVLDVSMTDDGAQILSASRDCTFRVWDSASGREILQMAHDDWVRSAVCTPEGAFFASCAEDRTVKLWDRSSGRLVGTLFGTNPFRSVSAIESTVHALDEGGRKWSLAYGPARMPSLLPGAIALLTVRNDRSLSDTLLQTEFGRRVHIEVVVLDAPDAVDGPTNPESIRHASLYVVLATRWLADSDDSPMLDMAIRRSAAGVPMVVLSVGSWEGRALPALATIQGGEDEEAKMPARAVKELIDALDRLGFPGPEQPYESNA